MNPSAQLSSYTTMLW